MRAAIYCRYSSDRQRETSIDDQRRVCAAFADREGWQIVECHSDEEVSGSTPVNARRGGAALMVDAMSARFDVLILEGLDRLSRDLVEQETIVRRLEYRGIRIIGASDGYDSEAVAKKLHRGMRGLINEVYLDDLRHKTHRGQSGQVSRGYSAGGGGYGYKSTFDGRGYRIEIDENQASWVRYIYERYAEGWSVKRIVTRLNEQQVPSPRGSTWCVSALYGSPSKGSGILNNCLYVGKYIWNRSQWVKNPDTGRRQRFERPESEWLIEDKPELRIVAEEIAQRVHMRMHTTRQDGGRKSKGALHRTLFGGQLRCGYCGGAVVAVNPRLYGCAAKQDRGEVVCRGVFAPREETEKRLLSHLRKDLMSIDAITEFQATVEEFMRTENTYEETEERLARSRLQEIEKEIVRLVDAVASVGISPALQERLKSAESERNRFSKVVSVNRQARPKLPDLVEQYKERVSNLKNALEQDVQAARDALREILGPIRVVEDDEGVWAEIDTNRAMILKATDLSMGLVAGARFELTTFGL